MFGYRRIPCAIWRGGTSKGAMLQEADLPANDKDRDQALLAIMGSPDPRQLTGLGGATPTTSKVAIISRSHRLDADLDYRFAQVAIKEARVDYRPTCGNLAAAVGPFAVEAGIIPATATTAQVRIFNINSGRLIESEFPLRDGQYQPDGETAIAGVPGTGSRVRLRFFRPDGGVTGQLFPTGHRVDHITLPDQRHFDVTVIDAGNLSVIVDGEQLDNGWDEAWFTGQGEFPLKSTLEQLRQSIGRTLNLFSPSDIVSAATHALPKITVIHSPYSYHARTAQIVHRHEISLCARALTMGDPHPAYPITGAIALAACAKIPGTVAYPKVRLGTIDETALEIGHPSGIMSVKADVSLQDNQWRVNWVALTRTARALIEGWTFLPQA